jgi:transposase
MNNSSLVVVLIMTQVCSQCEKLKIKLEEQSQIIKLLEARIIYLESELSKFIKLSDNNDENKDEDNTDDSNSSNPGYFDKMKKKPGKQFGKNKKKKKRGAKKGHKGYGRCKPETIDRNVDLTLECCPDCGSSVIDTGRQEKRIQEDLEIRKVATQYTLHHCYCNNCKKEVKPNFSSGFIGNIAKSLSTLLHYECGVPFNKIGEFFGWFDFKVSEGSMVLWANKFSKNMESFYQTLKDNLKTTPYVNVDETGWPIDGDNNWLWVFRAPDYAFYKINKYRNSAVVKDALGENYSGVLCSDFFSSYNPINCKKQKCLVHLKRDIREWDKSDNFEKRSLHNGITCLLKEAKKLVEHKFKFSLEKFNEKVKRFFRDFEIFLEGNLVDADCKRIMKRLRTHKESLWTFLKENVPNHNNSAELSIRRSIINRKVSCGNRSDAGARIQEILLSVIQTCKLQGKKLTEIFFNPQMLSLNST